MRMDIAPSAGGSSGLTVGTTTIANGTNGLVLYDNNGVLGEQAGGGGIGGGGATHTGSVVLTSASPGAQSITTTDYGQSVTLPDATTMTNGSNNFNIAVAGGYPLKVIDGAANILGYIYPGDSSMIGCADSSTAAGVWACTNLEVAAITARLFSTAIFSLGAAIRVVALDADRTLITMGLGTGNLYGVVYTTSTLSFGSPTLIRSSPAVPIRRPRKSTSLPIRSCRRLSCPSAPLPTSACLTDLSGRTTATRTARLSMRPCLSMRKYKEAHQCA